MRGAGVFMSRACWGGGAGRAVHGVGGGGGAGSQASVPHHPCTGSSFIIHWLHVPAGAWP